MPKLTAREQIALDAREKSGMAVTRYISLTKLIPPLLELVDDGKIAVSVAADYISDLPENTQNDLSMVMGRLSIVPSKGHLAKIKKQSKEGSLNATVIETILSEERTAPIQVTLKKDRLKQYFPPSYTPRQMEEVILSLLDTWRMQNIPQ